MGAEDLLQFNRKMLLPSYSEKKTPLYDLIL